MTRQTLGDLEGSRAWQQRLWREEIPKAVHGYREHQGLSEDDSITVMAPRIVIEALAGVDALGRVDLADHGAPVGVYLYPSGSFVHEEAGMLDLGVALGWRWRLRSLFRHRSRKPRVTVDWL